MLLCHTFIVWFAFGVSAISGFASLDDYLHSHLDSFEVLDPGKIVSKRSLGDDLTQNLHFVAFNRSFHLVLHRTYAGTASPQLTVQVMRNNVLQTYDASALFSDFYSGYVAEERNSRVSGYVADGQFHLTVDNGIDVLTFEPLWLLTGNRSDNQLLVYYESGIASRSDHVCGLSPDAGGHPQPSSRPAQPPWLLRPPKRPRRAAPDPGQPQLTRVCRLQLVADYTFVKRVGSQDSAYKSLIKIADDINSVYQSTKFVHPETGEIFTGIGFELVNMVALEDFEPGDPSTTVPHYNNAPVSDPGYQHTASKYLEAFGDYEQNKLDFSSYCLSHLVTFRAMQQNILGLAYLGSPYSNFIGGICSPPSMSSYGRQRMIARNIGMATYANKDGSPILSRQALLVSAHELGHNMGSEHDPVQTGSCSPAYVDGGPYLMYQIAVTGNAEHHSRFSECSSKQIAIVIKARLQDCFQAPENKLCGNQRREVGEDCDAGKEGDRCCDSTCRLRPGAKCSDINSPCCVGCQLVGANVTCQRQSQLHPCLGEANCTGTSDACPAATSLPDGTSCKFGVGTCKSGGCDSVCKPLGLVPCSCPALAESCLVCCQSLGNRSSCSAYRQPKTGDTLRLPENEPCVVGRCLANGTCEPLELGGSQLIVRLWDLIVQSGSNSVATFLWKNVVFSVIFVSLLLWVPACLIIAYQDRIEAGRIPSNAGGRPSA